MHPSAPSTMPCGSASLVDQLPTFAMAMRCCPAKVTGYSPSADSDCLRGWHSPWWLCKKRQRCVRSVSPAEQIRGRTKEDSDVTVSGSPEMFLTSVRARIAAESAYECKYTVTCTNSSACTTASASSERVCDT